MSVTLKLIDENDLSKYESELVMEVIPQDISDKRQFLVYLFSDHEVSNVCEARNVPRVSP